MDVLVLGSKGSTGKRYASILKSMGHTVCECDIGDSVPADVKKAVIATPTGLHVQHIEELVDMGYNKILCEKPISYIPAEIESLKSLPAEINMVNNWCYSGAICFAPGMNSIYYDNKHSGNEETLWNCIQLVYLAGDNTLTITEDSEKMLCQFNFQWISFDNIEWSYKTMLEMWLNGSKTMWTLDDAKKATEKVIRRIG